MGIENGSNGARTHDLSRVRRTLIPAELYFHVTIIARWDRISRVLMEECKNYAENPNKCGRTDNSNRNLIISDYCSLGHSIVL